ncbi:hypothetical protein Bca4012_008096 [Brassica carinata]
MMNLDQRWEKGSKWYQSSVASSKPVEQFLKAVDELQLKDITEFTSKIISKPLKMVLSVPIYDTVSSRFC